MNKFLNFLSKKKNIEQQQTSETLIQDNPDEIRLKSRPVVENSIEFDYEMYHSNWPDLFDGYLDHVIEDIKGGNLSKGNQELEVEHSLGCATMCSAWHPNPKNRLVRSKALFVSDAAIKLGVSMSREAKFFEGIRTVREKKHETRKMDNQNNFLPGLGKKEEEQKW
jgi:hypothetical protein